MSLAPVNVGRMKWLLRSSNATDDLFPGQRWKAKADYSPDWGLRGGGGGSNTRCSGKGKGIQKFVGCQSAQNFDRSPILLMTLFNLGNNQSAFNTAIHHMCALIQFILFLSYF